jgi:hypothetical protein
LTSFKRGAGRPTEEAAVSQDRSSAHAGSAEREEGTRKYLRLRRDELERRFPGLIGSVLKAD